MSSAPSPSNSAAPINNGGLNLSEADRKFLESAITCLKSPPELDIPKLAARLGVKSKSVTNRWCDLKKKLFAIEAAASSGGPEAGPVTPAKKRKGADAQGGSATKKVAKPRASKKKAVAAAAEEADENAGGQAEEV